MASNTRDCGNEGEIAGEAMPGGSGPPARAPSNAAETIFDLSCRHRFCETRV